MCDSCNCSGSDEHITFTKLDSKTGLREHQHHNHGLDHAHRHGFPQHAAKRRTIEIELDVLSKNDRLAQEMRSYFEANSILALNLVSSPGSGKTTILEKTITMLNGVPLAVIEGDQQTLRDAQRIEATGAPVIQVNTGSGCHLDAEMIQQAVEKLSLHKNSMLFIENVGNLVCPALFDLGEAHKVVIISVTEGEDKPLKYPAMFQAADVCLINKTDLLPYVDFDISRCMEYAGQVNNDLTFFRLSATNGQGMDAWLDWLKRRMS